MDVNPGRVAYEPNSLDPSGARENPQRGFRTFAAQEGEGETGQKLRLRPESFADHYSQARQFYRSMSPPEQRHIQNAFAFELSKVEAPVIRSRMLGHLALVEEALAHAVETAIGMEGERAEITPYQAPIDLEPSPALSLVGKAKPTLKGRKVGALVTDGADCDRLEALRLALGEEGAELAIVALKIGGVRLKSGKHLAADMALSGSSSVFFDAVAIFASADVITPLLKNSAAIDWVRDAFGHLKVIGHSSSAKPLFAKAGIADDIDEGVIELDARAPSANTSRRRSSRACGLARRAFQKATHESGQRSAGVSRGHFPFGRTRFDSQAAVAGERPRSRGKGVCARRRL
jgi:catalase